jgi:hypothetical protein
MIKIKQIGIKKNGSAVYAKLNCKKCFGRGFVGYSGNVKGGVVVCSCAFATTAPNWLQKVLHWLRILLTKKIFRNTNKVSLLN